MERHITPHAARPKYGGAPKTILNTADCSKGWNRGPDGKECPMPKINTWSGFGVGANGSSVARGKLLTDAGFGISASNTLGVYARSRAVFHS